MIKVIVAGDFSDNARVSPLITEGKFAELFAEVKPIIEAADYSLVNFEFPIVEGTPRPIKKCGSRLKGQKKSIDALKYAGFKCATLANNHILDQGEAYCLKTKALLEIAGIDTIGAGKNAREASKVLYTNIKGETLAIINCCEHEFSIATETTAGANALNPLHQYYAIKEAQEKADYVLVVVHGGLEHFQLPSPRMKELYRFFIDSGADAVVNHHQHCYSGYEVYQGKPIFYGIGNFCFDDFKKNKSTWNEGCLVELQLEKNIGFRLIPYVQSKDKLGVFLMDSKGKEKFEEKMSYLNKIISNDLELQKEIDSYYSQCSEYERELLNPYHGKVLSKLYNLGLLPECVGKIKAMQLLNHIECESHQEKMIYALKQFASK